MARIMETAYEGRVLGRRVAAPGDEEFLAWRVYCFDTREGCELPRMCFPVITDYLYVISTRGPARGHLVKLFHRSTD